MHQQLWGYKVEEKMWLGEGERKRLNITAVKHNGHSVYHIQLYYEPLHFPTEVNILFLIIFTMNSNYFAISINQLVFLIEA